MIEIASPATPQLGSLSPRVVPPRRRRSPKYPPGASRERDRRRKYHPMAGREHSFVTLHPSRSSLIVAPTDQGQTPAALKSP